jgi:protein phosphatase
MNIEFAQATDRGRVRDHNEDYLGCVVPQGQEQARGWLFALADGVGGQDRGEVASRIAVETLVAGFRRAAGEEGYAALLQRLVRQANTSVFEAGLESGSAMATTLVACALRYDRALVSHVGDSRCYRIRHGHVKALTEDHTVAGEQVRLGLLNAGEAARSETRHYLSRSLGGALFVGVETHEHELMPGDMLLLCSDGLHGVLGPSEIGDVLAGRSVLEDAVRDLVDIANERDGGDNVSVQLIRIRSLQRMGMYRGRPYKLA